MWFLIKPQSTKSFRTATTPQEVLVYFWSPSCGKSPYRQLPQPMTHGQGFFSECLMKTAIEGCWRDCTTRETSLFSWQWVELDWISSFHHCCLVNDVIVLQPFYSTVEFKRISIVFCLMIPWPTKFRRHWTAGAYKCLLKHCVSSWLRTYLESQLSGDSLVRFKSFATPTPPYCDLSVSAPTTDKVLSMDLMNKSWPLQNQEVTVCCQHLSQEIHIHFGSHHVMFWTLRVSWIPFPYPSSAGCHSKLPQVPGELWLLKLICCVLEY